MNNNGKINNKIDRKGIIWFLILAFFPTILLSVIFFRMQESIAGSVIIYKGVFSFTVMFIPGISALFVRKFVNKERLSNSAIKFGSWKPYLQISLLIPLLYIIIYAITGFFYQPDFTLKTFLAQAEVGELPFDPFSIILVLFVLTLVFIPIINFTPAFGEELGWRGYLLPKLLPLGRKKALIISGFIWGLWHLPFVLFLNSGNYPDKIAGSLTFTVLITLLGIYIGALSLDNESIILASYVHAVFNTQDHGIWSIIYPDYNPLIGGGEGVIGIIVLLPVALFYLIKTERNPIQKTSKVEEKLFDLKSKKWG